MGYVPSDSSQEASPGNVKKISYREALANGMWRVRTAPLVFYIGDAAYHMDPILLQGAGLGIEGAYRLAKTIKDSKFSDQLSTENDRTRSIDFDELMPDLMECENQRSDLFTFLMCCLDPFDRYFRYLRLKRLTTIMNLLQETNSLYVSQMRDKFCQLTPNTVKRSLVDTMIDKSLYY